MNPDEVEKEQLLESIIDEYTSALRAGERPSIEQFQQRHPALSEEIDEVLSSIAMIEQLKSASDAAQSGKQLLDEIAKLEVIGPYRIQREVGRGGMGVVFAAVHEALGRQVAIKVLPTPALGSNAAVERFQREAQTAAKLHHTNIVSVFGAGQGPGYHYYVMDFVDGQSLNAVIDQARLRYVSARSSQPMAAEPDSQSVANHALPWSDHRDRFQWAAQLCEQLADGLAHAHASGILHRDLKPSNVILDCAGQAWLTDFGLAKDHAHELALTKTGDVIGTPQYLPPESLEGKYDACSEVYGIGLVLYELVALQPAYMGGTPAELIKAIASHDLQSIRRLAPDVPLDLQTIVDKCLAREPSSRYQSAQDLRSDLNAFVNDRPIAARRPSSLEIGWRWAKRNPVTAGLSAVSAALLLLVAITASVGYVLTTSALRKEALVSSSLRLQQEATESARQQAEQNYLEMKAQYDRAESNVGLSIEAFDEMFKHLVARGSQSSIEQDIEGLREISGIESSLTTEDAKFLDRMVQFYEQFATLNANNDQLKSESAKAYRRVGNIYQIVGQIPPAISAYEHSLNLLPTNSLDAPESANTDDLLTRVRTQNELSAAHRLAGNFLQAQQWNQRSIRMLEASPLSKSSPDVRLELARTMSALGFDVLRSIAAPARPPFARPQAERPVAIEAGRRMWERVNKPLIFDAIRILDEFIEQNPENGEYVAVRASCYWSLAAADLQRDKESGFSNRNKAIEALDQLVQNDAENAEFQYLLALACSLTLPDADDSERALVERGASIMRNLLEEHPTVMDYHHLYAKLSIRLAGYFIQQQQRESAYEQLQSARRSIQLLRKRTPSDRSFALTMNSLGRELAQLEKQYREAGNFRVANEILQILKQIHPLRPE